MAFTCNIRLKIARPYARPRACPYVRVYIYCVSSFPFCFPFKNHVLQPVCQSVIYEKVLIFLIKKALYIWCVFPNPLLLHPLSRTGAAIVWHSDRNGVGTLSFFLVIWCCLFHEYRLWKEKWKKNFRFIWSIWNKVLTFAPAFKMRAALFDNLFETRAVTTVFFFVLPFAREMTWRKKKNKKKLPKIFGRYEIKSLPLHPLLKRKAIVKQAIFEQIYINNTSSTRAGTFLIFEICTWVKKKNRQYL